LRVYEQQLEVDKQGRQLLLQRFDNQINWTDKERKAFEENERQQRDEAARRSDRINSNSNGDTFTKSAAYKHIEDAFNEQSITVTLLLVR
jgi:hypothetical protein